MVPKSPSLSLRGTPVGFIGLGLMGRPMALNLFRAQASVTIHSRSQGPVDTLVAEGLSAAPSPAAVTEQCGIIILMVNDTPAVKQVVSGERGVLRTCGKGTLIIDMGTTDTFVTRELAERVRAKGGDFVDAPVSGGTVGAEQGSLVIMAGGNTESMMRAGPIFDVLGKQTTHVGDVGAGQVAKVANQIIVGLTIGAVSEALVLANRAGVDPVCVRDALQGGFADSRILELHGQRMIDRAFAPGGTCATQRKDLDQALALARSVGMDLPATGLGRELYDRLIGAGHGGLDHSALIKAIDADW